MRDPLLAAARIALGFSMAAMAFVTASSLVLAPLVYGWRETVLQRVVAAGTAPPPEAIWAIVAILLLTSAGAAMGFFFFRHLYRIVGTVGEGDPFVPANAERLRAMGWIVLAVHVIVVPLAAIGAWLQTTMDRFHANVRVSLGGLLLALVLFVLARVFREGTRLRAELEGTV